MNKCHPVFFGLKVMVGRPKFKIESASMSMAQRGIECKRKIIKIFLASELVTKKF